MEESILDIQGSPPRWDGENEKAGRADVIGQAKVMCYTRFPG